MTDNSNAAFNLWWDPWIGLESRDGSVQSLGIRDALVQAYELRGLYDPSPLTVVGIHRLLVAILQDIYRPQQDDDLKQIWRAKAFSEEKIDAFGEKYANRFYLFSEQMPFLQSADIPLNTGKDTKSVAYLAADIPAGTEVTHFRHGLQDRNAFCPACCTRGLVAIPAFATSGGAGIRPSINGVPPIYIIPGGERLFESLAASLIRPEYQPKVASKTVDLVWWSHQPSVNRSEEMFEVGYLHSLTFPARRVRLLPEALPSHCTRCGSQSEWVVRRMVFEMGEQWPKTAPFWFDPFAAYRIKEDKPIPIRPVEGKAAWREYSALFLHQPPGLPAKTHTQRPAVLDQIAALELDVDQSTYPFRMVGLRTDMKAKLFEWVEAGFDVPPAMLRDENAGLEVQDAVDFATDCNKVLAAQFKKYFSGSSKKYERNKAIRVQMEVAYWEALADPFRSFILTIADPARLAAGQHKWAEMVVRSSRTAFLQALDALDDNAELLSLRAMAEKWCNIELTKKRKAYLHE